jgi:hypothetical protein
MTVHPRRADKVSETMRKLLFVLPLLTIASAVLYIGALWRQLGALTFPLDDAWIHLTFARNLALRHEFAFLPGQASAGSTSPLWNFVLAIGFLWPFSPEAWAFLIGACLLCATAFLTYRVASHIFPDTPLVAPISALATVLEWHLNWAAYSGMETLLFITLLLLMLDMYLSHRPLWLVGCIGGLSMVARPEGVVMFGLVLLHAVLGRRRERGDRGRGAHLGLMLVAFALPIIPYVWFNWQTSGLLFPNTFYAKQAEYAELFAQHTPIWHWLNLVTQTFIGAQVLLVLGCLAAVWFIIKERRWDAGLLLAWALLLPALYALRLPVDYQHARYEMPVIPMLVILGVWGSARLYALLPMGAIQRVLTRVWSLTFALSLLLFWWLGAQSLANDAATMDCLVVQTAHWLAQNTQRDDLIAVHDIGAAGYYLNDRALFDVAGLITPDVIPFIRDEPRLLKFLRSRHVRYLVTNEDWHPNIITDPTVRRVYVQNCAPVRTAGRPEMGVYRLD